MPFAGSNVMPDMLVGFMKYGRRLRNNRINGTLDLGSNYSTQLQAIDLQNNFIERFVAGTSYGKELM